MGLLGTGQAGGCGVKAWKEAGSRKLHGVGLGCGGCLQQGPGGGKGLMHPLAVQAAWVTHTRCSPYTEADSSPC